MNPADELRAAADALRFEPEWITHGRDELFGRLADWLTTEANTWAGDEVHHRCSTQTCTLDAALAVARAINGGQP